MAELYQIYSVVFVTIMRGEKEEEKKKTTWASLLA